MALNDETTYAGAIRRALREELARDPRVCLLGEEIGYTATGEKPAHGLLGEFGPERIIEVPTSEGALIGTATGAALLGLRPVVELPYAALAGEAFAAIASAAEMHWRTAGTLYVPLVIRAPYGPHADPWRTPSPAAWFAGIPGLKIVVPSTPYDAWGLLKGAIRDNNPVLFLEGHYFYRRLREVLPEDDISIPLGVAEVRRPGDDVTVLTWGATVYPAMDAAETLAEEGLNAEVIDLRTLVPFDRETVRESVERIGRVLLVTDGPALGGVGAEIIATVAAEAHAALHAPPQRLGTPDVPYPAAPELAAAYLPDAARIADALRQMVHRAEARLDP